MSASPEPKDALIKDIKDTAVHTAQFALPMLFILLLVWKSKVTDIKTRYLHTMLLSSDIAYLDSVRSRNADSIAAAKASIQAAEIKKKMAVSASLGGSSTYLEDLDNGIANNKQDLDYISGIDSKIKDKRKELTQQVLFIKDSTNLDFDIPTLRPLTEKPRFGLLLWLLLLNLTFFFLLLRRQKIRSLLPPLFRSLFIDSRMSVRDTNRLHVPVPFWVYPIAPSPQSNLTFKRTMAKLASRSFTNTLWLAFLFICLLAVAIDVVCLVWNVNYGLYTDDYKNFFKIASLALLVGLLTQMLYWLFIDTEITLADYTKQPWQ